MDAIERLYERLETACADGTTPGAACVVIREGRVVHRTFHGITCIDPPDGAHPITPETVFDVASLTKIMSTTAMAMTLYDEGRLDLEAPVALTLPAFARGGKEEVTFEDLLCHRSGLAAWRPLYEAASRDPLAAGLFAAPAMRPGGELRERAFRRSRLRMREAVVAERLEVERGTRATYSDVGFMALGLALEVVAGSSQDRYFAERLAGPLGLPGARFVDLAKDAPLEGAAATRRAESRGGATLVGEVDDDNAFALGGVAGHAGIFATADEVAAFGLAVSRAHAGSLTQPFGIAAARRFLLRDESVAGSTRALGFDTPSPEGSAAGSRLDPRRTFGHLGFTGCSLWVDLSVDLVVALCTNRVHLGTEPGRIRALRAEVSDLAAG